MISKQRESVLETENFDQFREILSLSLRLEDLDTVTLLLDARSHGNKFIFHTNLAQSNGQ